ncbi:alpha/beta hydrolase family protein [Actinoplanes sp. TFC3]|uniref:alpha/beta hydrolase n=1 Tax=Actinoplanes sp. TFC3 TaxID=1710355 RepID=UPI00082A6C28|nr:alpha/beta hydrolase-fold protein [Actinoplanes sp. TFC3]
MITRRTVLTGAGAVGVLAAAGGYARTKLGTGQQPVVPDAPVGDERVEQRQSSARGRTVDFYTAVPDGHGDGRGLPVCLVLHGASKTAADCPALGLGKFLTDSVRRGNPPFVLAGATGDRLAWRPGGSDDPQRMVHEEIPQWCAERGFTTKKFAAWGWSMGGYGSLLLAETFPGFVSAVAAFSPAVTPSDDVFAQTAQLDKVPVGLWCGTDDGLLGNVRKLDAKLPATTGVYSEGRHNFAYWSTCIPAAFDLVARSL